MDGRGKDRIPYGYPGNNRRPGTGRMAKYPWRTWMSQALTWELDAFELGIDVQRFKKMVAVRVSQANKLMASHGVAGWVVYKCRKTGPTTVDLTFWWIPGEGLPPEDVVPPQIQDYFARPQNMSAADHASLAETLEVPHVAVNFQDRAKAILCPTQWATYGSPETTTAFDHWRGWKPDECAECAAEPGGPIKDPTQ